MIKILKYTNQELIATKAWGLLTTKDYHKIHPFFHNGVSRGKKIRWYFEMDHFKGWEPQCFWEDLIEDKHMKDIERIALVGIMEWYELIAAILTRFTEAEIAFFGITQQKQALSWLQGKI